MKGQTKRILVVSSKRTPSCKWPITSGFIIIIIIIIIIILSIPEKGAKGQTQGENVLTAMLGRRMLKCAFVLVSRSGGRVKEDPGNEVALYPNA